jgi:LacI family transcriptional regulator
VKSNRHQNCGDARAKLRRRCGISSLWKGAPCIPRFRKVSGNLSRSPVITRTITLAEIARVANVSPATVSKAINERDDISEETRQMVLRAAKRLNYRGPRRAQDEQASGLRRVGLISTGLSAQAAFADRPFARLIDGIRAEVDARGELVLELEAKGTPQCCRKRQVDGVIVIGPVEKSEQAELPPDMPVVFSPDPIAALNGVNGAYQDNFGGTALITRYLIERGHRRFVLAAHTRNRPVFLERAGGYLAAMYAARLEPATLDYDGPRPECLEEMATRLAQSDWTAVVAVNDNLTTELVVRLMMLGRRIPQDISIVGFDNWKSGGWTALEPTTVDASLEEVGRQAVQILNYRLLNPRSAPMRVTVLPKIVEGKSVAVVDPA